MSINTPSYQEVKAYYDEHTTEKLHKYIYGSRRIDMAWETLISLASAPKNILEIGCGLGDISYEMHRYWPEAKVTGLDISEKSIEVATRLFGNERVKYVCGILDDSIFSGEQFDLIVMMDVYEHIADEIKPSFNKAVGRLLSNDGAVFISYPTPRLQAYLKAHHPEQVQPVDEDITIQTIAALAAATGTEVILQKDGTVWSQGDYAYTFLRKPQPDWNNAAPVISSGARIKRGFKKLLRNNNFFSIRKSRINFVKSKLGDINI
ncbi:2-polyprenyl-3-methyl-5-hydroxy-6-metoxy-1,4-benzoquinol methylase [Chitinophaga terrae (ex Kim and Jung 2007)]|uniref:class I SAM-dependent methyltransferase n=1 Tax=Chitinophaga terrae (ex Kim and Jung 2007) TaxID=408074 RepID=UPI0027829D2A|nr:class I SAM-dependent methyltransferase [Chitinophaga terrae (ex Kim and Jung 2007)]MDQ0106593.1 2-polyprenyl-3-methyl-5-hydroxy-6-metoxy-1,4-benzoquinol methylase [Chitinophaga terrae (ex Kim and Jung 2007)]